MSEDISSVDISQNEKLKTLEKNVDENKDDLKTHLKECSDWRVKVTDNLHSIEKDILEIKGKLPVLDEIKASVISLTNTVNNLQNQVKENEKGIGILNAKNIAWFSSITLGLAIAGFIIKNLVQ